MPGTPTSRGYDTIDNATDAASLEDTLNPIIGQINDDVQGLADDVAATSPTTPSFTNGWASAPAAPVRYYKHNGRVYLEGVAVRGAGAATSALFTLPAGFRPGSARYFQTQSAFTSDGLAVATNGAVTPLASTATLGLDGVSFRAEA